jgi:hypothetical protein
MKKHPQKLTPFIKKVLLFLSLFLLGTGSLTWAQQAQNFQNQSMQQKQERLQTLINVRLVNDLGLSQEQALKVSEIMKKYHLKRRELRQKMESLNQQLREVVNSNDDKRAGQLVSEFRKTKEEIEGIDDALFKEIKPMLTPQQQARFILVMEDIHREIRQLRRSGGDGGPGRSEGTPGVAP